MSYRIYKSKYTGQEIDDLLGQVSSKVDDSMLGAAGGVATLDTSGKIPSQQMPENVAYTNKENTFTEPQTFNYVDSVDPNWSEYGEIGGSGANYSYTEYTDDTHKYSTSGEAYISSYVGRVMVGRSTVDEKGTSENSLVLDVRKNWIARTEINAERVDGKLGPAVQTYYAYKFPKTYPNKEVTLATIEDLTAQFGALNIQNGSGTKAIQQKQDGTTGTFDFTGKNPNATVLDPTLTGQIPYGATGDFAVSFGGKSAAQGKRSVSAGTTTIAKGKYSAAFGDNSVALGNDSFTANYQNTSKGQASAAFGSETQSIGAASVTFGKGTITNNDYELACGRFNNSQSGYLFSVGCGSSNTDRRNALWVDGDIAYCRSSNGDTGKIATLSDAENQANLAITKKFLNDDIQLSQNLNVIRSLKVGPDNIFTLTGSGVLFGHHLIANAYRQTVVGRYNSPNNNAFFQVGNGDDENTRKNAFEVWSDGRVKVQTAPKDNDDVVRKLELNTKFDKAGGTVTGDMVVGGNFTVQGKTTTVDSETLRVADKLIEVGKGNTAPLTSPAGLFTPKYDGTNNGGIVYDHTGTAYVGDITLDSNGNVDVNNSDLQPIATRDATITNGNIVKWDNTNKTLVDSGKAVDDLSTATNLENGSGDHSIVQKVIPSSTSDPNNYATGKEAVSLGRYSITKADRAMTVNYDNKNYGKWSFVANKSNRVGSENGNQDDVQSNAVFGEGNIIEKGIEGFVSGKRNINYEGDRFNLSGSENKNHTNLTRMSGWKNESLEELKTAIPSGGGDTPPDVPPVEPTNPFDYTSVLGYNDISGNENKVFAMGASTRGVAGVCYSPFGSTEGFWTKAGYIVEKERKDGYIYYKPQGLGAKAFGAGTWAKEDYTVAGGQQTQALKKGSIALGLGTIAKSEWSTMIGKYNVGYSDSVFEVGNGFSANDRSNLLTLYSDGRLVNKDGKAFITDINKTDWAHEGAADAGKILMLDSTGNLLLTNADNPTLSSHLVNKKFVQEYVAEHGSDNLNIENGTGNALVQTTDSNHSFKVMADGRAKVQSAPVDTDDVVRKLELDNVNARYVSTSILGG